MSEDAGYLKKTQEAVTNAGASAAGAFSGSLSLGANASQKKTTTTTTKGPADQSVSDGSSQNQKQVGSGGEQKRLTSEQADRLYEERMEEEYAKREGGA
jgi:hypothetical protein